MKYTLKSAYSIDFFSLRTFEQLTNVWWLLVLHKKIYSKLNKNEKSYLRTGYEAFLTQKAYNFRHLPLTPIEYVLKDFVKILLNTQTCIKTNKLNS